MLMLSIMFALQYFDDIVRDWLLNGKHGIQTLKQTSEVTEY